MRERKLHNKEAVILCALGFVTSSITLYNAKRTVASSIISMAAGVMSVLLIKPQLLQKLHGRCSSSSLSINSVANPTGEARQQQVKNTLGASET